MQSVTTDSGVVIDAQVHTWVPHSSAYPWAEGRLQQLPPALVPTYVDGDHSTDALIRLMDAAAVDVAVLVSPWLYGNDFAYMLDTAEAHPGRFRVVAPFAPPTDGLRDRLDSFMSHPLAGGVRVLLASPTLPNEPAEGAFIDAVATAAAERGLPVFVSPMARFNEVARIAQAFPHVCLVLDHCGLWVDRPVSARLALLDEVLALSRYQNILIKCTALAELSADSYPYDDVIRLIARLIAEYGSDRLMWGSDINQHLDRLTYTQAVDYIRMSPLLSSTDKRWILGRTAARVVLGAQQDRVVV